MTTTDHLAAIEARLTADENEYGNGHADQTIRDRKHLLAELRVRDEALANVADLIGWLDAASADDEPMYATGKVSARATATHLRAAVAAATGGGE